MTHQSKLLIDGLEVKARLIAAQVASNSVVHVDWLRFTVNLRNAPLADAGAIFPSPFAGSIWDEENRMALLNRLIGEVCGNDDRCAFEAAELARQVAEVLGADFRVELEPKKGQDFYKWRFPIMRNDSEVGWIGFGASSEKRQQAAQAKTIHVNLFGAACTFAAHGWEIAMADLIDACEGAITRCDLALDFFDGIKGGLDSIVKQYRAGLCDVGGRRPISSTVGDWLNGRARSLYFGSKESGKQTNTYEKGQQLFGADSGSKWLRIEVRFGNKLRDLPSDMLRRPEGFFAGASDWHAAMLKRANSRSTPEVIKCRGRLALETIEAEVSRNFNWALNTAAATISAAFKYLPDNEFLELCSNPKLPGRLGKFSEAELQRGFQAALGHSTAPNGFSKQTDPPLTCIEDGYLSDVSSSNRNPVGNWGIKRPARTRSESDLGREDEFWQGFAELRDQSLIQIQQGWGNEFPSIHPRLLQAKSA